MFGRDTSDCILYAGSLDRDGYPANRGHRKAYEEANGEIPPGLVVHHACQRPACINPEHLTVMVAGEHSRLHRRAEGGGGAADAKRAKTHCPQGHPYSGQNLRIDYAGARVCRECDRQKSRRHRARKEVVA